jgi:hypothetical protein
MPGVRRLHGGGAPGSTCARCAASRSPNELPNFALDWSAVGEISGGASTSASYKLNATIGQMAANTSSISTNYGLCTGFECVLNTLSLYLPLIRR